jgi:WD40 repeat protein
MTDSPPRAAETLRQVWSTPVPDTGAQTLVASSDTIVLGTGRGEETDLAGSLVVLDARTGDIARAQHDYWLVGPLALSPDGQWLAAAEHPEFSSGRTQPGDADRIRILDVKTGDERCRHAGAVPADIRALAYSLDGRSVAAIGSGDVLVFDAASGAERWRIHLDGAWNGLAWSPDGKTVAVGYRDGIAKLDEGFGTQRPNAPSAPGVGALAYSQDGARIVAGCWDGTIRAFDADSGAQPWPPAQLGTSSVVSVAISDDQRWVTGITSKILGVYDLRAGTPRYPPTQCADLSSNGSNVLFSPTLRHILAMDWQSVTVVVDTRTGRVTHKCPAPSCLISRDGAAIAAAGSFVVERYDLGVLTSEHDIGVPLTAVEMSPAAPVAVVADNSHAVTVIDAASGARLAQKPGPGVISSVAFADAGASVAVGGASGVTLFAILGARSWTVSNVGPVTALTPTGPAGDWIATAAGKTVRLLNSADGHERWPSPNTHPKPITRLAASSDGRWIATGCTDRTTRIIDALTGEQTFAFQGGGAIEAVVFQPNGTLAATVNDDGTIVIIDAATATKRDPATRPFPCGPSAFSSDGTLLAVACRDDQNSVFVYDLTGAGAPQAIQQIVCLAPVLELAFNPADNTLAVCTSQSLAVHDPRTGTELTRILQSADHFALSSDGMLIATTDSTVLRVLASGSSPGDH